MMLGPLKNVARFNCYHCLVLSLIKVTFQSNLFHISWLMKDESLKNKVLKGGALTTVINLIHCSAICCTASCAGVFYNEAQRICVPWRNSDTETTRDSPGWTYYPKRIPTVEFSSVSLFSMYEVPTSVSDINAYITSYCQKQGTDLVRLEISYHHAIVNQFIAWYFVTNKIFDVDERVVAIDGRQDADFNWYHNNGDLIQYFKWRERQPDNKYWQIYGNQTQLSLWEYIMDDFWNNGYSLWENPVLFVCAETQ